jgi:hypothetical protein
MTIPAAGQDMYGKTVGDLVGNDIKVMEDGSVIGTFHYVTGYTGFNNSKASEQEGYYFPFTLTKSGEKMTFKKNGKATKTDIAFEANNVFRVTSSDKFEVIVDGSSVVTFTFKNALFESKG